MIPRGHLSIIPYRTLSNVDVDPNQVIFDVLLRKGDLVEKFVAFANKPRLLQRFRERLADYKRFWEGVQVRVRLPCVGRFCWWQVGWREACRILRAVETTRFFFSYCIFTNGLRGICSHPYLGLCRAKTHVDGSMSAVVFDRP